MMVQNSVLPSSLESQVLLRGVIATSGARQRSVCARGRIRYSRTAESSLMERNATQSLSGLQALIHTQTRSYLTRSFELQKEIHLRAVLPYRCLQASKLDRGIWRSCLKCHLEVIKPHSMRAFLSLVNYLASS